MSIAQYKQALKESKIRHVWGKAYRPHICLSHPAINSAPNSQIILPPIIMHHFCPIFISPLLLLQVLRVLLFISQAWWASVRPPSLFSRTGVTGLERNLGAIPLLTMREGKRREQNYLVLLGSLHASLLWKGCWCRGGTSWGTYDWLLSLTNLPPGEEQPMRGVFPQVVLKIMHHQPPACFLEVSFPRSLTSHSLSII